MFQPFYECVPALCWIFASIILLCALAFLIIGLLAKTFGISFAVILKGEEYVFAAICSIVVFLTFSFPLALILWLFLYLGMHFIFKSNQKLIKSIAYYKENRDTFRRKKIKALSSMDLCIESERALFWVKDFRQLRKTALLQLNGNVPSECFNFKCKVLPFSVFTTGTIGIGVASLTYENLIQNPTSFGMILLENYAVLSSILFVLYWIFYAASATSMNGIILNGHKKTFNILFAIFSVFMCVIVARISMEWYA